MTVYCAQQFCGELDLLELKLETLDPYVDKFIISEGLRTHSGKDKPLYYLENKDRYKKFHDKIIYQVVDDTPSNQQELVTMKAKNKLHAKVIFNVLSSDWFDKNVESYLRDTYEKEALLLAMEDCKPDDIILLGDLDEIPRPEKLQKVIENFEQDEIYHFQNEMMYYYCNIFKSNEQWFGTFALSFENLMNNSFCKLRVHKSGNFIDNGGWHFTYMGGVDKVKLKVESWGEQSLNTDSVKDNLQDNIQNCISKGHDLFYRPSVFVMRDINDGTFPQYLVDNQDKFDKYIKR